MAIKVAGTTVIDDDRSLVDLAGNLPSAKPTDFFDFTKAKALGPKIKFERNSAVHHWDGKTKHYTLQNLIPDSNTKSIGGHNSTYNVGTAPDSTQTATECIETTSLTYHDASIGVTITDGWEYVVTSMHVKKIGSATRYPYVGVRESFGNWGGAIFNLSSETYTLVDSGSTDIQSAGITNCGNGWYRIWARVKVASTNAPMHYGVTTSSSGFSSGTYMADYYTGDGASGYYVWGLQWETGYRPTAYTPNASGEITRKESPTWARVAVNEPRFQHNTSTGECEGLLVEQSKTNALYPTWDFKSAVDSASVGQLGVQYSQYTRGLDGEATSAARFYADRSLTYCYLDKNVITGATGDYTYSVWLRGKPGTATRIAILSSTGGNIEPTIELTDEWVRHEVTRSFTNETVRIHPFINRGAPGTTVSGTSLVWADYIDVCWPQVETGSYATSYIRTDGNAITRSADLAVLQRDFSDKMTLACTYQFNNGIESDYGRHIWGTHNNAPGNYIKAYTYGTNSGALLSDYLGSRQFTMNGTGTAQAGVEYKNAVTIDGSTLKYSVSSLSSILATTSFKVPASGGISLTSTNGVIKTLALYDEPVTNEELLALTGA